MGKLALRKAVVIAGIFLVFNMMVPGAFMISTPAYADDPEFYSIAKLGSPTTLHQLDPTTLLTTSVIDIVSHPITIPSATVKKANGLAHSDISGTYAVLNTGSSFRTLATIDLSTGATLPVVALSNTGSSNIGAIAFDDVGTLYAVDNPDPFGGIVTQELYTLSLSTGAKSPLVCDLSGVHGQTLAFNSDDKLFYHVSDAGFESVDPSSCTLLDIPLLDPLGDPVEFFGGDDGGPPPTALTYLGDNLFLFASESSLYTITSGGLITSTGAFFDGHTSKGLISVLPPTTEIFIDKIANDAGLFSFTITDGSSDISFSIPAEFDTELETFTGAHGPVLLEPETEYEISEGPLLPGWKTDNVSCTNGIDLDDTDTVTLTPTLGDSIKCTFTNTFTDSGDLTKKEQKQAVIDSLIIFEDPSNKKNHKHNHLVHHIEHSLKDKLWEDENTPDSKHGKKIFDEEEKAVKELKKALKKADEPLAGVISSAIVTLVGIDKMLAEDAIEKAESLLGDEKELDKSDREMKKADQEIAKGHPDHAIDKFKKAWEHAQHAIKKAS